MNNGGGLFYFFKTEINHQSIKWVNLNKITTHCEEKKLS